MISVSLIIPVFNQFDMTSACLESISRFSNYQNLQVVLIDNGSTQSLDDFLSHRDYNLQIKLIRNETNLGFSKASNQGAEQSDGEILIFLNNDTLPRRDWIAPLVRALEDKEVGVVGSKLVYPSTNTINHAGYVFGCEAKHFYPLYQHFYADHPALSRSRFFPAVLGAALAVRRSDFFRHGPFSMYGLEDIDLCLSFGEQGLKTKVISESVVAHFGSHTFHSEPGETIPQTTSVEFSRKWNNKRLNCLDLPYYEEDGFLPRWNNVTLELTHTTDKSFELLLAGSTARGKGELNEAVASLTEAIQHNPRNKHSLIELIHVFEMKQEYDIVGSILEQLLIIDPLHFEAYYLCSRLFSALGSADKAELYRSLGLAQEYLPFNLRRELEELPLHS